MSHVANDWAMLPINESCRKWMSHVENEWVKSQMNESCRKRLSHATNEWIMSQANESWHQWMSCITNERAQHPGLAHNIRMLRGKKRIRMYSCVFRVARSSSGAKAPPLAARPWVQTIHNICGLTCILELIGSNNEWRLLLLLLVKK